MRRFKIFSAILFFFLFLVVIACREEPFWVEDYGDRKVLCVKSGNQADELIKFELNEEGNLLTAVYWQKNAAFGYLIDLRTGKLFIDASSGIFFRNPSDFYESLMRDVDWQKVKDSLTKDIIEEFCQMIEKAVSRLPQEKFLNPAFLDGLEKEKRKIRQIDLEAWYCAVDSERSKIHALGLEYCIDEDAAQKLLSKVEFNADYRQIVGSWLENRKQAVVCLGENHPEDADKEEAVWAVKELRPLGFNYLLLECISFVDQKILDEYQPFDKAKRQAMLRYLKQHGWDFQSLNAGGRGAEAYLEVIDYAKEMGYKIIGIGNHQRDNIEFVRNNYWVGLNVVDILRKDSEAKIIVFAGATHVFPNYIPMSGIMFEGYLMREDIPAIVKKTTDVDSLVFECIGGLKDAEFRNYLNPGKVLEKHIEKMGWDKKRFFIPVPSSISTLASEFPYYYIHLPQITAKK